MTQEEIDKLNEMTEEPTVIFKLISDRQAMAVETEDEHYRVMEISGYDLNVSFNRDLLKSVEDVESLLDGLKEMFRRLIMKDLLENPESTTNKESD